MDTAKKIRKISCLIVLALLIGMAVIVLRGPHVSNALKKMILPELEMATGYKVIAQKIYINIFPLFVEAKNLKMFDDEGKRIFVAKRVKAYLDLSGIIDRNVKIRRLVIKEPEVTVDRQKINEIVANIKAYLAQKKKKKINVEIKAVEVQEGKTEYFDTDLKTSVSFYDFRGEIIIAKTQKLKTAVRKVIVKKEGWPEISAEVSSDLLLEDGALRINRLTVNSFGSQLTASGNYAGDVLKVKTVMKLVVKSVKDLFHLGMPGEGRLGAKGDITYRDKKIFVDMKLSGEFYLETLMELLNVKERIQGLVNVKGYIKGQLNNIKGTGTATLQKGNLYNVDIDYLKSAVSYADGVMSFTDAQGKLYNGQATASASMALPVVNMFTLDIDFSNADSLPLFKLIGWDPGIQPGKVTGVLHSSGDTFNPAGRFQFRSVSRGNDVLGRIKDIDGNYTMNGSLLTLSEVKLNSEKTNVSARGLVDLEKKTLDIDCSLKSSDVTDITSPYYNKIQGKGEFYGRVSGAFHDPVISGRLKMVDSVIEGYRSGLLDVDLVYRKELFHVTEFVLNQGNELHRVKGDIYFRNAKNLFELTGAEFQLHAVLRNAGIERFVKIFYPDFKATGIFSSEFTIRGTAERPDIHGTTAIPKASLYDVPFDSASFELNYNDKKLYLSHARVKKGNALFQGDFTLYPNATFSYKAYSDKVMLSDLVPRPIQGEAVLSVKSEGSGAFDDPTISVNAKITDGVVKGRQIGDGVVTASIKNKNVTLKATLLNDKISIDAKGRLEGELPWDANVNIRTGRYDFLVASLLKDLPEDLILSLNGSIKLRGTRKQIAASSRIKHMVLSMYGYSFTNEEEMILELHDRDLSFDTISLRSGNTLLNAKGGLTIGKEYNLTFEGSSALSPFKSLSSRLGLLKGNAEFVMEIVGGWESPKIYGSITLEDGAIGLKDYPHRISSLNGYLYIDNDRVVLQKLSGKTGGGDIDIAGIFYLRKFAFRRFYVEAKLKNISTAFSKDFHVNYDGNILYKGTPSAQIVSGDITINNARYRERVEWKSWLLKAKTTEKIKSEISNLENAELNIKITGKNNMSIDNNVARAAVTADMILRGTLYRPVLSEDLSRRKVPCISETMNSGSFMPAQISQTRKG
jgi:translocation and assembly module TamB